MSTYAEMDLEAMSYDELSELRGRTKFGFAIEAIDQTQREKSAVMTALVELAAEMDEAGLVVVPWWPTDGMEDCAKLEGCDRDMAFNVWRAMIEAAPPLTREA